MNTFSTYIARRDEQGDATRQAREILEQILHSGLLDNPHTCREYLDAGNLARACDTAAIDLHERLLAGPSKIRNAANGMHKINGLATLITFSGALSMLSMIRGQLPGGGEAARNNHAENGGER